MGAARTFACPCNPKIMRIPNLVLFLIYDDAERRSLPQQTIIKPSFFLTSQKREKRKNERSSYPEILRENEHRWFRFDSSFSKAKKSQALTIVTLSWHRKKIGRWRQILYIKSFFSRVSIGGRGFAFPNRIEETYFFFILRPVRTSRSNQSTRFGNQNSILKVFYFLFLFLLL